MNKKFKEKNREMYYSIAHLYHFIGKKIGNIRITDIHYNLETNYFDLEFSNNKYRVSVFSTYINVLSEKLL